MKKFIMRDEEFICENCHKEVYRTWDDVVKEMLAEYKCIIDKRK